MLKWEEVAEMRRLGMTIAAHTLTHPNLPNAGLTSAFDEIAGSKRRLEQELGEPIRCFRIRMGAPNATTPPPSRRLVANAGFAAATTSRNGFARCQQ